MPKTRRIAAAGSRRLRQDRLDPCAAPRRAGPHRTALWATITIIITAYAYACTFECSSYELDWLHARSFNGGDAMLGASASDLINQSPHGAPLEAPTLFTLAGNLMTENVLLPEGSQPLHVLQPRTLACEYDEE